MMTSSNGNIFRVTGPLCGEFTGPGEFSTQRPVTRSFDVFFDLRLNKRLSKQPWGWWVDTLSRSLWRHCNVKFGNRSVIPSHYSLHVWSIIHDGINAKPCEQEVPQVLVSEIYNKKTDCQRNWLIHSQRYHKSSFFPLKMSLIFRHPVWTTQSHH